MKQVEIYTDGACWPNPGTGGWAAILIYRRDDGSTIRKEIFGAEVNSTNNRMELMGAIEAFKILKEPCKVSLYSDSQYLVYAFNQGWLDTWQVNGWRARAGPVKNQELWVQLLDLTRIHKVSWNWVRGHSGHVENERADLLAGEAILKVNPRAREGVWY